MVRWRSRSLELAYPATRWNARQRKHSETGAGLHPVWGSSLGIRMRQQDEIHPACHTVVSAPTYPQCKPSPRSIQETLCLRRLFARFCAGFGARTVLRPFFTRANAVQRQKTAGEGHHQMPLSRKDWVRACTAVGGGLLRPFFTHAVALRRQKTAGASLSRFCVVGMV